MDSEGDAKDVEPAVGSVQKQGRIPVDWYPGECRIENDEKISDYATPEGKRAFDVCRMEFEMGSVFVNGCDGI